MAVRFVWKMAGFAEMRKSPGIERLIAGKCEAIAAACGEGFVAKMSTGKGRVRGTVVTATPEAMVRNARDNTLVNNLGAGR